MADIKGYARSEKILPGGQVIYVVEDQILRMIPKNCAASTTSTSAIG